jgi:hypothetical protein
MQTHTTGAIALRPTGNAQGGYYFFSLTSGRRLNRNHWTDLSMPKEVINRVHTFARRSNANRELLFAWRDGTPVEAEEGEENADDDINDTDYNPDSDSDDSDEDDTFIQDQQDHQDEDEEPEATHELPDPIDMPIAGVVDRNADEGNEAVEGVEIPGVEIPGVEIPGVEIPGVEIPGVDNAIDNTEVEPTEAATGDDNTEGVDIETVTEKDIDDDLDTMMDTKYGERKHKHQLRPRRRPKDYNHVHTQLENIVMTQYSVKKGLKVFGEAGAEAVISEMKQLHDRKVIEPKAANMLTREEKRKALRYLMFLKKKRCGRINGRGCADGRDQRLYKTKEKTSAPTVSTEALMLSCVMDAEECCTMHSNCRHPCKFR